MSWLTSGESKVRLLSQAVVVSILAAAAFALRTEEMVKAIVEYIHEN
jgi:hypothetical protein